ncbi:M48 family metallopeptidase [Microcoleus sp.]
MTIKYLDKTFLGFQEYIQHSDTGRRSGIASAPVYAHPVDEWIIRTLNATPVKAVLNKAMDALVSLQFGHDLASSVFIDQKSFPDVFEVVAHCAKTLDIPIPHAVTKDGSDFFNAYTVGTDEYALVYISPGLCQYFSKKEASFVIGHECGHIAAGHAMYHTLVQMLTGAITPYLGFIGVALRATAGIPLMAWSRRAEVTADRAGLLCCGDIAIAERALLRLVTGIADVNQVDIEDYLRKFTEVREFHKFAEWQDLNDSHPEIPKRIQALRLFANSEIYYSLTGKEKPVGKKLLNQEALNQQVSKIVQP